MSVAAAQAASFIDEVTAKGAVWAIRDEAGFPTSTNASGESAMPFWSLESRAKKVIDQVQDYEGFNPYRLTIVEFVERWLPGLDRDGLMVGLNWSGNRATGYDMPPSAVLARLQAVKN